MNQKRLTLITSLLFVLITGFANEHESSAIVEVKMVASAL